MSPPVNGCWDHGFTGYLLQTFLRLMQFLCKYPVNPLYPALKRKYPVNPLYPALKRLPFFGFQSSLIADRGGSAIWPAIETPKKGKPLLRQCTDSNRSLEGDISLNGLTEVSVVFLAFAVGGGGE